MSLQDWQDARRTEMHRFRGAVTMIGELLGNGCITATEAAARIADADAKVTQRFAEIDAQWERSRS